MRKKFILHILLATIFLNDAVALEFGDISVHGFVSQGYLRTDKMNYLADTKDGTFEFNEMALNFSSVLSPGLRAGLQVFAYDIGERGNDKINLEWCYGDYQWKNWLGFRVGAVKSPFGLFTEVRDVDALRTSVFLPLGVYPELVRDDTQTIRGIGIYGDIDVGTLGGLSYTVVLGKHKFGLDKGIAAASGLILDDRIGGSFEVLLGQETDTSFEVTDISAGYVTDAAIRWDAFYTGLLIAVSGFNIDDFHWSAYSDVLNEPYEFTADMHSWWGYVVSIQYTWNDFIVTYENFQSDYVYTYISDFSLIGISRLDGRESPESWYISVTNRFSQYFELGLRYSEDYAEEKDKDGSDQVTEQGKPDYFGWAKSITLSIRFDIDSNWCAKFEYMHTDGQSLFNNAQNDDEDKVRRWGLYAAKITYMF